MAEFLFLVETDVKAEVIRAIAGDKVEVVVLCESPATYSIVPQGESSASVFCFQKIPEVWGAVVERLAYYDDVYYCFDTSIDGEYLSYLVDQLLLISVASVQ